MVVEWDNGSSKTLPTIAADHPSIEWDPTATMAADDPGIDLELQVLYSA